ncbi:MAG TPA: protein-disulfide reductase DsbD domain-containing protein [Terriglobia bacterium]|nr:protein-disulfide reductase DsbD domain-containing protein [Terriglobia bacterium]
MRSFAVRLMTASLLLLVAGPAFASGGPQVVSAQVFLATDAVHAGQAAKAAVVARIRPGYHINDHKPSLDYLIPTRLTFQGSPVLKVEAITYPQGKPMKFDFLDSPISVYEGEVHVVSILKVDRAAKPGTYPLSGKFMYQACNDHACLAPTSVPLELKVRVVPASVPLKAANAEVFKTVSFR